MSDSRLYGMNAAFDEIVTTAVTPMASFQGVVGALLGQRSLSASLLDRAPYHCQTSARRPRRGLRSTRICCRIRLAAALM
jgi:hypothetical protein